MINKIDSPLAETEKIIQEVTDILGFDEEEILKYSSNSVYNDPNHPFRVEMEKLRLTMVTDEEPEEVGAPKAATEDFVEQIKKDAEEAPKIEETIPKEEN